MVVKLEVFGKPGFDFLDIAVRFQIDQCLPMLRIYFGVFIFILD